VAILIVTVIIKILLFPLQHKSFKSMKEMQLLQPEIAKLREKYKDNKEKLNQEMMALYRAHKVNPAGGCLPMLAQLPIFIAFYRALGYSIELRHTPFVWWLQDLSAQDPYYITPILMGVTMFVSQKMTPTSADPAQARVMQLMPIMFTFLFLSFPAGLVLYWLTNNILSIAQQAITNKYLLPAPAPIAAPPARTGGKKQDG
jgi:YidC/Oxa1 family membrane protein insertase